LVVRQSLPGYVLGIERMPDDGTELLTFRPVPQTACAQLVDNMWIVSCYQA